MQSVMLQFDATCARSFQLSWLRGTSGVKDICRGGFASGS